VSRNSAAFSTALLTLVLIVGSLAPAAAAAKPAAKPPKPPATIEGLDVSMWQGAIDWTRVAAAGKRFAFIRASAGSLTADTTYVANRAGAKAAGLKVAAYHFANPDAKPGDALAEADHFLALATPTHGELLPVLDLEVTNGLSVADMQAWAMTWLEEVRARLGVRAMIYTSPSFWQTSLGDSSAFSQAGYTVLWIAHWGVSQPRVPASNWGGRGWTFWQTTNLGTVPGVSGPVDLDRYKSATFDPALFIP